MKTLVDIPDEDVERLDALALRGKRSRAAEIRDAVKMYLIKKTDNDWLEKGFGLWKDRTDIGDAVEYQRRIRAEWTRPWDRDYEDVKAEFPDLFDEHDDRERAHYLKLMAAKENAAKANSGVPGQP